VVAEEEDDGRLGKGLEDRPRPSVGQIALAEADNDSCLLGVPARSRDSPPAKTTSSPIAPSRRASVVRSSVFEVNTSQR
jgi:hypothetical protein